MSNEVAPEVRESQELVAQAASKVVVTITNAADYSQAGEILRGIKAMQKRVEDLRTAITAPLNAALKAANDQFRGPAEQLKQAENQLKATMIAYDNELQRKRQEEQRRADEQARRDRERLQKQAAEAEAAGKIERAEVLTVRAEQTVAPVIQREAPKVQGVSGRMVPKFEITNAAMLPREYLMPDESKIRQVVNALKADTKIAGVRVWMEKQIASRSM